MSRQKLLFTMWLLVFLLASQVTRVVSVDGCHDDRDRDHRPRVTCRAAWLSNLPAGLEPSTEVLRFPTNLFSSLSWSSFQMFPNIYEIDLTDNKVPQVMVSASPMLPSLSVLRLGRNLLRSLPAAAFIACPALVELFLNNNAIDSLSDSTFSGLSKLEILDLSGNHISVLPQLLLHPLPAIETLYLTSNKIKVIPDDWFSQKEEVPYLFLSLNPWLCTCSLGYLRRYLEEYDYNVYVQDGQIIIVDSMSVVCDSPPQYKHSALLSLEESELCMTSTDAGPAGDVYDPADVNTVTPAPSPSPSLPPATTRGEVTFTRMTTDTRTVVNHVPTTPASVPPLVEEVTTPGHWAVPWFHSTSIVDWTEKLEDKDKATQATTKGFLILQSPTDATRMVPGPQTSRMTTPVPLDSNGPWVVATTNAAAAAATTAATTAAATTAAATTAIATTTAATTAAATTATATTAIATTTAGTPATATTSSAAPPATTVTSTTSSAAPTATTANKVTLMHRHTGAEGVFCLWLFAGSLLLSVAAAACTLATAARLVIWYRRWYKPLRMTMVRRGAGRGEGARLLTHGWKREREVLGGGGVTPLYRSVLFISREGEGKGLVCGGGGAGELMDGGAAGSYRKTLYRLWSKQEEIEGWRDVMEEGRVTTEGGAVGGAMGGAVGGAGGSRKRYSVIVREEREGARGGRAELDWVVGRWEFRGGEEAEPAEGSRSSWGERLVDFLPSMPWGQTMSPEAETAQ